MGSIVINGCYGGFSISLKGIKKLWELSPEDSIWNTTNFEIYSDQVYIPSEIRKKIRTDKYLISCIQKYGSKFMSGQCALLTVVHTDSSVVRIQETDGYESLEHFDEDNLYVLQ